MHPLFISKISSLDSNFCLTNSSGTHRCAARWEGGEGVEVSKLKQSFSFLSHTRDCLPIHHTAVLTIDADGTKFVFNDRNALAVLILQYSIEQCCFSSPCQFGRRRWLDKWQQQKLLERRRNVPRNPVSTVTGTLVSVAKEAMLELEGYGNRTGRESRVYFYAPGFGRAIGENSYLWCVRICYVLYDRCMHSTA